MLALWKTCGDPVGGEQRDRLVAEFPQQLRLGVEHGRQALRADHHRRDAPPPWASPIDPMRTTRRDWLSRYELRPSAKADRWNNWVGELTVEPEFS
jgi:hypothetical protein